MELVQKQKFDPQSPNTEESVFVTNIESNGGCVAISGDGVVKLYDESSFKCVTSFATGQSIVHQLAFNTSHQNILSICSGQGNLFLIDTRCVTKPSEKSTAKSSWSAHIEAPVELFSCAYDNNILCGGDDHGTIYMYDTRNITKDLSPDNNNNNNNNNNKNKNEESQTETNPSHMFENVHGNGRVTKLQFYGGTNKTKHLFSSGEDGTVCEHDLSLHPLWNSDAKSKEKNGNTATVRSKNMNDLSDEKKSLKEENSKKNEENEENEENENFEFGDEITNENGDGDELFVNSFDCVNGIYTFGMFENNFMYALTASNALIIHNIDSESNESALEFDSTSLDGLSLINCFYNKHCQELRLLSYHNNASLMRISQVPFVANNNTKGKIKVIDEVNVGRSGHVGTIRCALQFELQNTATCRYLTGGEDNSLCIWKFDPEKARGPTSSITQQVQDFLQEDSSTTDLSHSSTKQSNPSFHETDEKMPDRYSPARSTTGRKKNTHKFGPY